MQASPSPCASSKAAPWPVFASLSAMSFCSRRSTRRSDWAERPPPVRFRGNTMNVHEHTSLQPRPFVSDARPNVFVVDDDVSVRESLELLVRQAGWQVETFASAREFLARPRDPTPSCLVLDVNLPDLNGLDLQKRLA